MILNIFETKDCELDNKIAYFFNVLQNTFNTPFKYDDVTYNSVSYFIYGYLLKNIPSLSKLENLNMTYPYKNYYEVKKEYSFYIIDIPKYINEYISVRIKDNIFLNKLKEHNNLKYKSNHKNTLLYILSSSDFNLGNVYNEYVKKLNNAIIENQKEKEILETHQKNKIIVYDIFYILEGLYKIMFDNNKYSDLSEYENTSFNDLLILVKKKYGNIYLSYKDIDYIYKTYLNKQIKYYSIYDNIINYPFLKDNIVILFILQNFNNYNSRIKDFHHNKVFREYIDRKFVSFVNEGEEPSDDESEASPYSYTADILSEIKEKSYKKLKDNESIYYKIIKLNSKDDIPIITEEKYDKLSIFIENKKYNQTQKNTITSVSVKPKTIEKKSNEIQYSLFNNLVSTITNRNDEDANIISDNNILSPIYKSEFKIELLNNTFIFETLFQYIYFKEYYVLYNIYTKNEEKSYLLSYNYLFKNTSTNILSSDVATSDEFKNIKDLEDSYETLLNDITLYLFNEAMSFKKNNKYLKFVLFYINKIEVNFHNDNMYLGLINNKGDNIIGHYFSREHYNIIKYNKCPDNFYIILEILSEFDNNILAWINYHIEQICNYIIIIHKYNKLIDTQQSYFVNLFSLLNSKFILQEKDVYITPLLSSFKTSMNRKINELKTDYNIQRNLFLSDSLLNMIWIHINLLCNHLHKKKLINSKLQHGIIDSLYEFVNKDYLNLNVNNIGKIIDIVETIIDLKLNTEEFTITNNDKYTLIFNFIQGKYSDVKCSSVNEIIKNIFNDTTTLNINNKTFSHIKYKLSILEK